MTMPRVVILGAGLAPHERLQDPAMASIARPKPVDHGQENTGRRLDNTPYLVTT